MAIPETQLDTWSHQGSITQSSQTYATIRSALKDESSGYAAREYKVFLQGSYCNDTNIYAESDVDVVIRLDTTFIHDLSELPANQAAAFRVAYADATYGYDDFKRDVIHTLTVRFGSSVKPGKRAINIESSGNRRSADVIAATEFRRYVRFNGIYDENYVRGICFFTSDGQQIANYPKQHSENCTGKHQATGNWFKPMVRILKNMRGRLVEKGVIASSTAPSYFIEGLLYNVPTDKFGESFASTFINAINWIRANDRTRFVCANEQYYLLRNDPVCWKPEDGEAFLNAVIRLWSEW